MIKKYIERLKTIDRLISIKGTGAPKKFAKRLGISERTLYESLSQMKEMGAPICYSAERESYYYQLTGSFFMEFKEY